MQQDLSYLAFPSQEVLTLCSQWQLPSNDQASLHPAHGLVMMASSLSPISLQTYLLAQEQPPGRVTLLDDVRAAGPAMIRQFLSRPLFRAPSSQQVSWCALIFLPVTVELHLTSLLGDSNGAGGSYSALHPAPSDLIVLLSGSQKSRHLSHPAPCP